MLTSRWRVKRLCLKTHPISVPRLSKLVGTKAPTSVRACVLCVCVCACMYVCVCACMYVCICMYVVCVCVCVVKVSNPRNDTRTHPVLCISSLPISIGMCSRVTKLHLGSKHLGASSSAPGYHGLEQLP